MRILILSPNWPFPADNGGKLRAASVASYLAQRHEVVFLCFTDTTESLARQPEAMRFQEVQGVSVPARGSRLRRWFSRTPAGLQNYSSPAMARCVDTVIARFSPEVLLVGDPLLTQYVVPYADRVRILDYICVETLQFERLQAISTGLSRILWFLRRLKFAAYLRRITRYFDLCLVNSEEDQTALLDVASTWRKIEFLPNGLDLSAYPLGLAAPQPKTMIFPGALTYTPNRDAITYFLRDVLPRIRTQVPDVTLSITGQVPTDGSAPQAPGVVYTGYVSDIRPMIAGAWVCPVPLRTGAGGARFKVLEALALGTPIVSTMIGAEGVHITDGVNMLMAEEPEEFAAQTVKILQSPELRERLAAAGRQLIEQRYNWEVLGDRIAALAGELVDQKQKKRRSTESG